MLIRVRLLPPFSPTAPFRNPKHLATLREAGIECVPAQTPGRADLLVTGRLSKRGHLALSWRYGLTPILVWTDEPRHDFAFVSRRRGWGVIAEAHFMNCYTQDVFTDHFRFALKRPMVPMLSQANRPALRSGRGIALLTYRQGAKNWSGRSVP